MNAFDDEPTYRRSHAARHGREDEYPGGRDAYGGPDYGYDPPTRGSSTGASGRASVGRASVSPSPSSHTSPYSPAAESAPVGRAKVGRASVPGAVSPASGPSYGEPYGDVTYGAPYGVDADGPSHDPYAQSRDPYPGGSRGSHGSYGEPVSPSGPSGGLGGPSRGVGRASVRPVSPSGPAAAAGGGGGRGPGGRAPVPGAPGGPGGPGGPGDPGGPGGPGGGGPGGPRRPFSGFGRRFGGGDGGRGGDGKSPLTRRGILARRRNMIVAAFAVFIMVTGVGVVGGTYYVDSVQQGDQLKFPETTTVYYADGSLLAKLGEKTRYQVAYKDMNKAVTEAIVASEDKTFWTNQGVDFKGVVRAAWNNFTGGSTQGASTITQQYARLAFDLKGATYNRKLREAVLAWKIDDTLSKEQILESYLNSVPFGRQTNGVEAAAKAYFGPDKTVKASAPPDKQITKAEAMALVAMVKQPEPDPDNPDKYPGYDPTRSDKAAANAKSRWDYVRGQMVDLGYLTPEENAALKFPENWTKYDPNAGSNREKPAGIVVNHALSELTHTDGSIFKGKTWETIQDGGYSIYTTLMPGAQHAAEAAADETVQGSVMYGQPPTLQAALVAVEPGTGRVLAYYGGHDGKGADYAGFYYDEKGAATGFGRYPPGSSFKVYTLAAALKAGISLNSYWQWTPHKQFGRPDNNPIRNASKCPTDMDGKIQACSLLNSTVASLNVPFYDVTLSVTPVKVLEMARDAGIDNMWTDDRVREDLSKVKDMSTMTPGHFDIILGIGQYPVTVMDHANGVATFAAGGLRAKAHFVTKVMKGDKVVYGETLPSPDQPKVLNQQQVNDLTYALNQVASGYTADGWDAATKTGTWEYNNNADQNAHAWNVGFTKKIAAAVWVGNRGDEKAIYNKDGGVVWGSGLPASIWRTFMTNATKSLNFPKQAVKFNPPNFIGNENPNLSVPSPTPSAAPVPTIPVPTLTTTKPAAPSPTPKPSNSATAAALLPPIRVGPPGLGAPGG